MQISIQGYQQRLPVLLTALLETFAQLREKTTEERFLSVLDGYKRALEGMEVGCRKRGGCSRRAPLPCMLTCSS